MDGAAAPDDPAGGSQLSASDAIDLVRRVQEATPTERVLLRPGLEVIVKREDTGPTGSFKWRGALTALEAISRRGGTGVVTASTGNQGAAVAWAAQRVGLQAHVVVPVDAVARKCALIEHYGARLHREGADMLEAADRAAELARDLDCALFEDGASAEQLLGTATIADELVTQADVDLVIVPIAGGALAAGFGRAFKEQTSSATRIVGVQSVHFSKMSAVLKGLPYKTTGLTTFADGLADDRIVEPAFSICRQYVDDVVTVADPEISRAIQRLHELTGIVAEGAGAAPLAALLKRPELANGQRTSLILTGGNLDPELQRQILGEVASD